MRDLLEGLDPLKKGLFVLVSAIILAFTYSIVLNLVVFVTCFLAIALFSRGLWRGIRLLLPVLLLSLGYLFTGLIFGGDGLNTAMISATSLASGLQLSTRILAFAGLGLVFSVTTQGYDFVMGLKATNRLPRKFIYGILSAFHLLGHIKTEYQNARLAMEIRGQVLPLFSLKPLFITLANAVKWAEALSMAMESRGFDEEG